MSTKMGRPKLENPNTIRKSFAINKELLERVKSYCEKNGITFGQAVRNALEKMY